jgi:hypothetical protein
MEADLFFAVGSNRAEELVRSFTSINLDTMFEAVGDGFTPWELGPRDDHRRARRNWCDSSRGTAV